MGWVRGVQDVVLTWRFLQSRAGILNIFCNMDLFGSLVKPRPTFLHMHKIKYVGLEGIKNIKNHM